MTVLRKFPLRWTKRLSFFGVSTSNLTRHISNRSGEQKQRSIARNLSSSITSPASTAVKPLNGVIDTWRNDESECLTVRWADDKESQYPYVWLRDNCQCPECYHPVSRARLFLMRKVDPDIKPATVEANDNNELIVNWPDGHFSLYEPDWLRQRSFTEDEMKTRDSEFDREIELWDAETMYKNLPVVYYHDFMTSDEAQYKWLYNFDKYGLGLVKNLPGVGSNIEFANRIAFPRCTGYGVRFEVTSKHDPSNLAYTSAELGLHTDQPYHQFVPGAQFLHCLQQTPDSGGENQFVDGFRVAQHLKETQPDVYKTLTTKPIDHWNLGEDYTKYYKIIREPLIKTNPKGEVVQIRFNNQARDSFMKGDPETIKDLYRAMKAYNDTCYTDQFRFDVKVDTGDMVAIDNHRVMHGRNAFPENKSVTRELEGTYVDWDEVRSTIKYLRWKLKL